MFLLDGAAVDALFRTALLFGQKSLEIRLEVSPKPECGSKRVPCVCTSSMTVSYVLVFSSAERQVSYLLLRSTK